MTRPTLVALCFTILSVSTAIAQKRCVKGVPCGNTCIAASKTCHVGQGTAVSGRTPDPVQTPPAATTRSSMSRSSTSGTNGEYVAIRGGSYYFWAKCSLAKGLDGPNLVYFRDREEARRAGLTPFPASECAGPPSDNAHATPPRVTSGWINPNCVVSSVIDGDTFDCLDGNRVRLLLIDAPEMSQGEFGPIAKAKLRELIPEGEMVLLQFDVDQRDRYGRILAYVSRKLPEKWIFVNYEMVQSGMAIVSVYPPNVKNVDLLRKAADSAKTARVGLWATSAFECTPSDHRAGRCN
jgi:endonuclease YncB( thermonuclease family)